MASAVALEESTDKHPVTPGAVLPARELQGDLLMALGRPAEALAAYEASLAVAPNRSYALAAAVRAADGAGRREAARAHCATLEKVAARADGSRPAFEKVKAIAKGGKESRQ
jgi:tetratricopeptide (TPR) repeat protein